MTQISGKAKIGKNVQVGSFTVIHDNVVIGDNVTIEEFCVIGRPTPRAGGSPLVIGDDSLIRSHSVFYEGSTFGSGLHTGHHVTVREKTVAGKDLQIGTLSDFQGFLQIGDHCRTHSNVHLGQGSKIGNFVWIFPYVVLTNDPHPPSDLCLGVEIEDYAIIATMSVVLPGLRIGRGAMVGAGSVVNRNVVADALVVGNPAKQIGETSAIKLKDGSGRPAYPWTDHFHRGYPEAVVKSWIEAAAVRLQKN